MNLLAKTISQSTEEGKNEPCHLAVIMDGNRRWAAKKNLPGFAGHRAGVDTLKEIVKLCPPRNIKYLTVYVFSTENWSRKKEEVDFLFDLFSKVLEKELNELHEQGVKLNFIGDRSSFEPELLYKIEAAEKLTKNNKTLFLQVAFNYGARNEILDAVRSLSRQVADGKLKPEQIDFQTIENNLYTTNIPDPDLLIRTGGEQRVSNYLLWQIAYSEIIFSKVLWPDFSAKDLDECLSEFSSRTRRFGK
ncbi:MAG: polyprenyl diphosphate synthase [Candidatus Caenarcaniphilales bacterium]|nr:polyprenyl diphosphate synthase [Candidatus Caenarcaniphilales bacterium]